MIIPQFTLLHKIAAIATLAVLAAIFGAWGGHKITKHYYLAREAQRLEEVQEAMTAMIDRSNELAKADAAAAAKAERARQQKRIRNLEVQHELELEAQRNYRPECSWTDRERGLLNDLIDRANGHATAPAGVPDGLRPPAAADGRPGPGREGLVWPRGQKLWRMSQPTR